MDTEIPLETALPQTPPQPSPENGSGQSADGIAATIAAEQGKATGDPGGVPAAPAKPRGRPPIHGLYSKAAGSDGKNPVKADGGEPVAVSEESPQPKAPIGLPAHLLGDVAKSTLESLEALIQMMLTSQARQAGLEQHEINAQLEQAHMMTEQKKLVGTLTPYALQELGADPNVSPCAAIGFILAPWLVGSGMAYVTLAKLAEEKAKRDAAKS